MSRPLLARVATVLALVLLATFAPRAAHADDAADRKGRAHARAAKAYFDAGDYAHAIVEYQAAYDLDHKTSRLYNLGVCHERAGDKAAAIASYRQYLEADPDGAAATPAAQSIAALDRELAAEAEAARKREADEAARRAAEEEAAKRPPTAPDGSAPAARPHASLNGPATPSPEAPPARATVPAAALPLPLPEPFPEKLKVKHRRSWVWAAVAGAALVGGVLLDTLPDSAHNGTLDGNDFLPLPLYAFGATCLVIWAF